MKKIILVVAVVVLVIGGFSLLRDKSDYSNDDYQSSNEEKLKVKIAIESAYPPFSKVKDNGEVVGFDIDIANALCQSMNAKCELIVQEWDGMIPGLLAKKYDAIVASMSITEERKKKVNFTDKYYSTGSSFIGKKDFGINIPSDLEALKSAVVNLTIGVQQATVSDNFVSDNLGKVATIKRYSKQEEANLDLISGRLDLIMADTVPIGEFLKTDDGEMFEFKSPIFANEEWFGEGIGIAVRKEDEDLKAKLNEAIASIREEGIYDSLAEEYFDFDIYGE